KMSKSLGNVFSLEALLDGFDPRAFRLLVLQSHYRSPMEVSRRAMASAQRALARIDELSRKLAVPGPREEMAPDADVVDRFRRLMDDDLATPAAVALVFETATAANTALARDEATVGAALGAAVVEMLAAVGLAVGVAAGAGGGGDIPADVAALVDGRSAARTAGDWGRADAIRDELAALGWVVKDTTGGVAVHRDRP
ncbi:MAG: CysS/YqeB C-terminal domain-containing protein, partial [Acidimicrobiales bacterium]